MAYITVLEYVALYGARETGLFTLDENTANPPPAPGYDATKVETAITDATEEVEGYIARRYATPLASPPTIVKGWVRALARLKLAEGTGRVSEAIKDAADRATRQLERLVDSKIDLPVPENGAAPDPVATGSPMSSGDRPVSMFAGRALDGFTEPFTGGGYAPCWRQGT